MQRLLKLANFIQMIGETHNYLFSKKLHIYVLFSQMKTDFPPSAEAFQ